MSDLFAAARIDDRIASLARELADAIAAIVNISDRIVALNSVRGILHEASPLKGEPVDLVIWTPAETVDANDYNPNAVAPPEMRLLEHSIVEDGYTQPIVTWLDGSRRETVDGFHRGLVGRQSKKVRGRTLGYLPVTTVNMDRTDRADRIASTIRHNRARGRHAVDRMSDIVLDLSRRNWPDTKIARELGMEPDEVLRLKQITGLAEMFADREFSEAWEAK